MTNTIIVLAALKGGVNKSTLAVCIGGRTHRPRSQCNDLNAFAAAEGVGILTD